MVVWIGYIDESGTHSTSSHIVVASVLATAKVWQELHPKWQAALESYGLTFCHAVEFNRGTGECAKLTKEERDDCAKKLIGVVSDAALEYIVYAIERTLFESKNANISMYDYLLATTIGDLMIRGERAGVDAMFVFIEDGCGLTTTLCDLLKPAAFRRKLGPVGHINYLSKDSFELQVADMIAYETFKYLDNRITSPEKAVRRSFQKIMEGNPLSVYLLNDAVLEIDLPAAEAFLKGIPNR